MKKLLLFILLASVAVQATTKIRLHNSPSAVAGYKAMDLFLGPAGQSVVTSVTQETSAGNDIQWTNVASGTALKWITPPLSSTTTISGTITFNFYAKEAATSNNSTIRPTLILYHGGAETTTITNCGFATELTASIAAKNWTTASGGWTACSVTSTAIAAGDRIVLKAFINGCTTTCTVAGSGMGTGTVTVDYDGATDAADGSSWVQLNETETFSVDGGASSTPDLVQWRSTSQSGNASQCGTTCVSAGGKFNVRLMNGTVAGNALVLDCYSDSNTGVITVTDDQSNTWNQGPTNTGVNSLKLTQWYALNVAANTRVISPSPATASNNWKCTAMEFKNVATASALDVSAGTHANSNTFNSGSFTPNVANDLLVESCFQEGVFNADNNATAFASGGTQGTVTWSLVNADLGGVEVSQWGQQGAAAAINPQITATASPTAHYICVASAFLTATSGGSLTGMYVFGEQDTDTVYFAANPGAIALQFPSRGNLSVLAFEGTGTTSTSGVTSTNPSGTWNHRVSDHNVSGHTVDVFDLVNITATNTMTITPTEVSGGRAETYKFFDIVGAATAPYDTNSPANTNGSAANHNPIAGPTITPSVANGVILGMIGVAGGTITSVTGTCTLFTATTFDGEFGSDVPADRNNGWGVCYNTSTSNVTFTWVPGDTSVNTDGWLAEVVGYKPPVSTTIPGQFARQQ